MTDSAQLLAAAIRHHESGALAQAEAIYNLVLRKEPNHADALHLLGLAAHQRGDNATAEKLLRRAVARRPDQPLFLSNLSRVLSELGQYDEAIAAGRLALQIRPDFFAAHFNIGTAYAKQSQWHLAIPEFEAALRINPQFAAARFSLGESLKAAGQLPEAIAAYRTALHLRGGDSQSYCALGNALFDNGEEEEAIQAYEQAARCDPAAAAPHYNLGNVFHRQGRLPEAVNHLRRAVELDPRFVEAQTNLGNVLEQSGRLDEAVACFRRVIELSPKLAVGFCNLANALKGPAYASERIERYRQALALQPDLAEIRGFLLFGLLFHPDYDQAALYAEHLQWDVHHGATLRQFQLPHPNDPAPDRRIRVGYVSADLWEHVVGRNVLPLLREHDHDVVEIYCYSNSDHSDRLTERIKGYADHWRDIHGVPDETVGEQIRSDRIDVLVDLSLHTAGNRLPVFARKPAPVQVTFAGYPGTTGLSAIDYRLTDPYLDPPEAVADYSSEVPFHLPHSFWCFDPWDDKTAVGELPALAHGHVTFGCLNAAHKLNEPTLRLWAKLLTEMPGSRLMLLAPDGEVRTYCRKLMADAGVSSERLIFSPHVTRAEYLNLYNQIDISLDPLPYNGHSTSLDSFWMGVPVVTLVGRTIVGRAGLCQLMNLGLPELVAYTAEQFVSIASELGRDLPRLAALRRGLRQRMQASPLMDAAGFARGIEDAYRTMWRTWCQPRALASRPNG